MSSIRAASRYAKSLLELAEEKNILDEVHGDMQLFSKVCEENRDFVLMLKNPVIKHDKKRKILSEIFNGKVHQLTSSIFTIITQKNREAILPLIAKEFHLQYNVIRKTEEASITTALKLTDELREKFRKIVLEISGMKHVNLEEKLDPEIIGGYILKVGDKQIDDSVHSKLKMMGRKFAHNPFIREI